MLFTEFRFFAFFAIVFAAYWLLPGNRNRKVLLLVASYTFYGAWDYRFLSLIVLSTVVDYIVGLKLAGSDDHRTRKHLVRISLAVNLGMLGIFKYFNFFIGSFIQFAQLVGLPSDPVTLNIVLPVGISFYTFQTLSYTIDIYRRKLKPTRSLLDFAVFVGFFPQLVAGPIVRARAFLPQLREVKFASTVDWRWALTLFLVGFFKKSCIADNLAQYVDVFYAAPLDYSTLAAWAAVLAYSVQLYCDFSGYSDMAIATAALLGYRLCENFNFPYFSTSIREFWQRWHISLSSWLRDYLYSWLRTSLQKSPAASRLERPTRNRISTMLTMLLAGLWHGAAWNFVIFGGAFGLGLVAYDLWSRRVGRYWHMPRLLAMLLSYLFVVMTLVIFRAGNLTTVGQVLNRLFITATETRPSDLEELAPRILVLLSVAALAHWASANHVLTKVWRDSPVQMYAVGYGLAWSAALATRGIGYTPFIYFQF